MDTQDKNPEKKNNNKQNTENLKRSFSSESFFFSVYNKHLLVRMYVAD